MKRLVLVLALGAVLMATAGAWATPIYEVYQGHSVTLDLPLGPTFDFTYKFEVENPVGPGNPWTRMALQIWVGTIPFLGQVQHNSTTDWLDASFDVSAAAPGLIGTVQPVRFSVDEFGRGTNTTVYVTNLPGTDPVPEPATIALFAMGGIVTAASRLRKKK